MSKFSVKVGDRVKCIGLAVPMNELFIRKGDTGTVVTLDESGETIQVKWDKPNDPNCDGQWWCDPPDLELVA